MHKIEERKRQGLSIRAISRLTGYCRKSIRKYLIKPESRPVCGPRPLQVGKLSPFKPYLEERMRAVWGYPFHGHLLATQPKSAFLTCLLLNPFADPYPDRRIDPNEIQGHSSLHICGLTSLFCGLMSLFEPGCKENWSTRNFL